MVLIIMIYILDMTNVSRKNKVLIFQYFWDNPKILKNQKSKIIIDDSHYELVTFNANMLLILCRFIFDHNNFYF